MTTLPKMRKYHVALHPQKENGENDPEFKKNHEE